MRAMSPLSADVQQELRPESVAPPGFCNGGEVRYGSIGGLEYEVPQSRLYCLCINVALCSTALQCICRVLRRSSMTMKAHTYYIIFGRPPIGGKLPPSPPGGATGLNAICCKRDDELRTSVLNLHMLTYMKPRLHVPQRLRTDAG